MVDVSAVGREQRAAREPASADRGHDVQQRQGQEGDQGRQRDRGEGPSEQARTERAEIIIPSVMLPASPR